MPDGENVKFQISPLVGAVHNKISLRVGKIDSLADSCCLPIVELVVGLSAVLNQPVPNWQRVHGCFQTLRVSFCTPSDPVCVLYFEII